MVRRKENVRVREVTHAQNGKGQVFFHDWLLPEEAAHHGRVFSKVVISFTIIKKIFRCYIIFGIFF